MADAQAMTIPKQAIDAAAKAIADSIGHGMSEKCFDHARAALTAAAPHMSGAKVKQLDWSVLGRMHKADLYEIEDMGPNWSKDRYQLWYNRKVLQGVFVTLDEARSAAQEDFEDNVRECIDGGFDVAEVRRQALEEAAKLIEEGFEKAVGQAWRNDGKPSKNDRCPHGKFMYEDCERCASDAIRALKSRPAQAEEVIASERLKLEATARVGLQLSEELDRLKAELAEALRGNRYAQLERIAVQRAEKAETDNAAKDARIAELEEHFAEMTRSCLAERDRNKALEADNKRLREALETIADGNFLFPSELRFSARAALGEAKP